MLLYSILDLECFDLAVYLSRAALTIECLLLDKQQQQQKQLQHRQHQHHQQQQSRQQQQQQHQRN